MNRLTVPPRDPRNMTYLGEGVVGGGDVSDSISLIIFFFILFILVLEILSFFLIFSILYEHKVLYILFTGF